MKPHLLSSQFTSQTPIVKTNKQYRLNLTPKQLRVIRFCVKEVASMIDNMLNLEKELNETGISIPDNLASYLVVVKTLESDVKYLMNILYKVK